MKLLKFNLIFIPFLALCLGVVAYIARTVLLDDARQHVIQNARIIMETMLSSRTYTPRCRRSADCAGFAARWRASWEPPQGD